MAGFNLGILLRNRDRRVHADGIRGAQRHSDSLLYCAMVSTIGARFAELQSIGRLNLAVRTNHSDLELARPNLRREQNLDFFTGLLARVEHTDLHIFVGQA